jgi:hypothetical protein
MDNVTKDYEVVTFVTEVNFTQVSLNIIELVFHSEFQGKPVGYLCNFGKIYCCDPCPLEGAPGTPLN